MHLGIAGLVMSIVFQSSRNLSTEQFKAAPDMTLGKNEPIWMIRVGQFKKNGVVGCFCGQFGRCL